MSPNITTTAVAIIAQNRRYIFNSCPSFHCREILQQVAALNSAAQSLALLILQDHLEARVNEGSTGADIADRD
ncbi:MAG: metal-sensing transcriptional repressor [Actinomycetota bacterium]